MLVLWSKSLGYVLEKITISLKENVSQEAFTQNRQQDPMLAGDPDKILIKF